MPTVSLPALDQLHVCTNTVIAWKVHFNGHGKGNFEGERVPTNSTPIQEYYSLLQKRKDEFLGR
jgi:hypothetical protein